MLLNQDVGFLTLFGIMTSCCALLMEPDSNLPRITIPMSWWNKESKMLIQLQLNDLWFVSYSDNI